MQLIARFIPLTCKEKTNEYQMTEAKEKGLEIPERKTWHEVQYNHKEMQELGGVEIEISEIRKAKSLIGEIETGKEQSFLVRAVPYNNSMQGGRAALSLQIVGRPQK